MSLNSNYRYSIGFCGLYSLDGDIISIQVWIRQALSGQSLRILKGEDGIAKCEEGKGFIGGSHMPGMRSRGDLE